MKLLDIFAKGTVGDFKSFEKENGDAFFAAHGLFCFVLFCFV